MYKKILFILVIVTSLSASNYDDFFREYQKNNFTRACKIGKKIYSHNERDEKLLSVIGKACLKADYISTVGTIQSRLRTTKEARVNSVIFSTVVLQKRLIYQFMYDGTDISTLALPVFDHPLSHTFVAIRDKDYKVTSTSPKTIEFDVGDEHYKVYIDKNDSGRIVIEVKDKNNKITTHRYL